ncbi:MAG: hypothetical protein U0798_08555 [Gemmataceae bacterium]
MNNADHELLGREWATTHHISPIRLTGYPSGPEWRWDLADVPLEFHTGLRDSVGLEQEAYRMLGAQVAAHAGTFSE